MIRIPTDRPVSSTHPVTLWLVVFVAYIVIYSSLLFKTDGFPYVLDNNESYSSWWHARSLYENGISQTKGLTDEVFSTQPAASPYIHSHQGNLPRLYTFVLYALGFRSIAAQTWITTFTVGLVGIYLAFRFLSGLANARYAVIACLVMMTNYLLFAQWHANLYHVWHVFFFFSSLLCVRALGDADRSWRWTLLAWLNFAAFFYWEYVFTAFVTLLCGLYSVALHYRRPRRVLLTWSVIAGGALLAGGVLLLQLTAYMGWDNVRENVRLTLTARNTAADPAMLERVTSFYREHGIIFWHNFLDAAPLRTVAAFWDSLLHYHLRYYTAPLLVAMSLIGLGWLLGLWHPRVSLPPRQAADVTSAASASVKWLGFTALLGWLAPAVFPPGSVTPKPSLMMWPGIAALTLLLGRIWFGGWWAWARLGWIRFSLLGVFLITAGVLLRPTTGLTDMTFQETLATTAEWSGLEVLSALIAPGALLLGLSCAALGNGQVLGSARSMRLTALPVFFLCTLLAYAATYRIFTGYVYSGYLHRLVPILVFATDMVLALAVYAATRQLGRRTRPSQARPSPWSLHAGPAIFSGLLVTLLLGHWFHVQLGFVRIAPPDSYAFLSILEREPFRNRSVVSNTYPAPMVAHTGAWGYADPSFFSGRLTLTPRGFETERDLKYLWFADRDTNPAYLKPDLAITVVQTPNFDAALQLRQERAAAVPGTVPLAEAVGLVQRSHPMQQAFLQHQLAYTDKHHISIVKLDWDYPPFLRPDIEQFLPTLGGMSLPEKLALRESAQKLRQRWRVTLSSVDQMNGDPGAVLKKATIDGRPLFTEAIGSAITTVVEGLLLQLSFLRGPQAGKIRVEVNDRAEILDLESEVPTTQNFSFSSGNPHGRHTYVPFFAPGLYVQTLLRPSSIGDSAEVRYHYVHQEDLPEAGSIVRVYGEDPSGQWQLADSITFLGSRGIPVRVAEFRRANPDTVAEFTRIVESGEKRTYEQWLADYLTAHPADWSRAGIVLESLPTPSGPAFPGGSLISRRVPLPPGPAGRWQLSVAPGTRTKSGPEYFGLPFTWPAAGPSPSGPIPVEFHPPAAAVGAPLTFGRIKLRLRFPTDRSGRHEPIVTTGSTEAGDFIYASYLDPQHIRFGFDHWFKGGPLSPPIPIDFTKEHDLEISIGSLFPAAEDVVFATTSPAGIQSVKNRVLVILNGQVVIDTAGECYETGSDYVTVGKNNIKGSSCGPLFTGKILSIERVWPEIQPPAKRP